MSAKQSLNNCLSRCLATAVLLLLCCNRCCNAAVLLLLLQWCGAAGTVCWQVSQLNAELELQKEKFGVRMSEVQASCSQQVNQLAAVADCCCCGADWWH